MISHISPADGGKRLSVASLKLRKMLQRTHTLKTGQQAFGLSFLRTANKPQLKKLRHISSSQFSGFVFKRERLEITLTAAAAAWRY